MSSETTKNRIMDTAEKLFSSRGYSQISMRDLTRTAGTNLASVNYHFGSKESLLAAVISRRIEPLNQVRMDRLQVVREQAAARNQPPQTVDILAAFIEPTLLFRDKTPAARAFISLNCRGLAEADDTVRRIFLEHMRPLFQELLQLCAAALPVLSQQVLYWRLHFVIGALNHTLHTIEHCPMAPPGCTPPVDTASLIDILLPFLVHGMEAPCETVEKILPSP